MNLFFFFSSFTLSFSQISFRSKEWWNESIFWMPETKRNRTVFSPIKNLFLFFFLPVCLPGLIAEIFFRSKPRLERLALMNRRRTRRICSEEKRKHRERMGTPCNITYILYSIVVDFTSSRSKGGARPPACPINNNLYFNIFCIICWSNASLSSFICTKFASFFFLISYEQQHFLARDARKERFQVEQC